MSVSVIRRPPTGSSTLAMVLTSPPAEKPTNTSSMLVPAIRSACSTASRIAISLLPMSTIRPRLTPRLSRWPVPRMRSRPSASGAAIIAEIFDEPMSSAATSLSAAGARRSPHQIVSARSAGGWPGSGGVRVGTIAPGSREIRT